MLEQSTVELWELMAEEFFSASGLEPTEAMLTLCGQVAAQLNHHADLAQAGVIRWWRKVLDA